MKKLTAVLLCLLLLCSLSLARAASQVTLITPNRMLLFERTPSEWMSSARKRAVLASAMVQDYVEALGSDLPFSVDLKKSKSYAGSSDEIVAVLVLSGDNTKGALIMFQTSSREMAYSLHDLNGIAGAEAGLNAACTDGWYPVDPAELP